MRNLFSLVFPARGATPLAALGLLLATAGAAQAQTTTNFAYTSGTQTYTVPAGITKLNVVATGGGGGGNRNNNKGGLGAVVQATVTVVPGEVLTVVVGGRGVDSNSNGGQGVSGGGAGGYNGGGTGAYTGGGGGGATDLRRAAASGSTGDYFTSRNALLVAGGGGGADSGPAGGAAGTPNGGNGVSGQGGPAGQGATTTALGGGYLGSNGTGGNGNPNNFNAAGGGGYYGGGGAGGPAGSFATGLNGGGGGSSYVLPTGSSNVSYSLAASRTDGALAITTVPTPTNNALNFDGADDYVALPASTPVPVGNSNYTIEAWIKPTSMGTYGIVGWGNYGSNNQVNALRLDPANGGSLRNYWWANDLNVTVGNLADGKWHHVAATFDGTTRAMYVDGVFKGSDTPSGHNVPTADNMRLGVTCANCPQTNGFAAEYFPGSMDEVRIYNVGLTQAQVQADMYSTAAAVPASQKYYANFDQGTAGGNNAGLTSLTDQSGNNSTGTLTNFALTGTSSNFVRSFPTITGILPTSGAVGTSLTLTGTNLTDATGFAFNGTGAVQTTPTNDLIATVAVPGGATTGPVSVASTTLAKYNGPVFTVTGASASTNNALAFDGTDDYVAFGATPAASNLGPGGLTLEAWVYYDGNTGVNSIIRKTGDYNLYLNSGKLSAEVWPQGTSSASWRVINGSMAVPANRWTHVAATWNPTSASLLLYVNGTLDGATTGGTSSISGSENLTLGKSTIYGNLLSGRLDEVRIYKAVLTAAQVQADMFSTSSAVPASQVAYFNFDQGTAGGNNAGVISLADQSGNGSTGTLTNFALTGTSSNWVRSFPTITGISPTSGNTGSSVTVTGTNLTDATGFAFNGAAVSPFTTPSADLTATVAVPSGATTGPVSVSSATLTNYNGPTFTVTYADLVVNNFTTIPAGIYNSITVNSPGVATLGGNVTVNTSTTVNSGATLNDGCNVLSGAGSFTLAAGGSLLICNAAGIAASGATGAIQNTGSRSFASDASYVYRGTGAQSTGSGLPAQVRSLTTTTASTLTLSQATSVAQLLTVGGSGNLATGGRALTLLSSSTGTALLVNSGSGAVSGATTIQRYIDPSLNPSTTANPGGKGYRHYSSPVANTTVADLTTTNFTPVLTQSYNTSATPGTTTPFPNVFSYDQSRLATVSSNYSAFDKGWVVPAAASTPLTVGQGYAVNIAGAELVDFVGTPNTGTYTVSLSRNSGATAADAGWNLVGNPYPAPLDYSQLQFGDLTGADRAMYVQQSTGQYAGQYRSYVNGNSTSPEPLAVNDPLIAAGQGFFVRVSQGQTSGSITFQNYQRVTSYGQQATFQRTAADARPRVHLTLAGAGLADAFVAYAETGATAGFDRDFDAAKLPNPTGLNLSSATATDNLAIDGRAAFTAATVLPLSVGVPAAGTYTLSAATLANLPTGLTPTLRDAATGQLTPLVAGTSYRFSVTAAEATALLTNRFTLQFGTATALATAASLTASEVTLYPNPAHGRFTVQVPAVAAASAVQAELLNTLGQVVRRQSAALPAAGATLTVETAGLASGVYTLRLAAGASTLAKRVVLQ